jgi:quercetin dioxygenase-like cupin family protein
MANPEPLPSGLRNPVITITSHNAEGKAVVHSSSQKPWTWFGRGAGFNVAYTTGEFPPSLNNDADIKSHEETMASGKLGLVKKGGTVCRIVDFAPTQTPTMHRTQSLDYGVVLEGTAEMELDDGSVTVLQRGDIAVQRGTNHAWRNPSETEWCRMLFVLQDCQPIHVEGQRLKEDLGTAKGTMPDSGNDD